MRWIFSAMGGSGSTYLITSLRQLGYDVGDKPDTVYRSRYAETRIVGFNVEHGKFDDRAGTDRFDASAELDQLLPQYIHYLSSAPSRTAVLNTSAELGLLSRLRVRGVVFLVRDPLYSYASWCRPQRHGDVIDHLGGVNDVDAVSFFARRWVRHTNEYFRLKWMACQPAVIRYESAASDSSELGLSAVFADLDSARGSVECLSDETKQLVRHITYTNYNELYPVASDHPG